MHTETLSFDTVVAGAGVVGLATARALALEGANTLLVERESQFGSGISARNSEVIHAGIYYPPGSLKARLCVAGNAQLYAYCAQRQVAARRLGKLIVATEAAETSKLDSYLAQARANGVEDLVWLDQAQTQAREPAVRAVRALFSPSTGIVDSHGLMQALLHDFEQAGGTYVARTPVLKGAVESGGIMLELGGAMPCRVRAKRLVNAAGMGAQALARSLSGFPAAAVPQLHYAIGHYFALQGKSPFRHLVYPVAVAGGLGVHLTLDLAGQPRFGPDLAWRDAEDYAFDAARVDSFYGAIRRYWPALPDGALSPAYTGIRPKLFGPSQPEQDFMVQTVREHGVPGLVNLFGIESPGLTSCLALADHVAGLFKTSP